MSVRLRVNQALGFGATSKVVQVVSLPDEHGTLKDSVVLSVGQHVAFRRLDDGHTTFVTGKAKESHRSIVAAAVSPNRRVVAVSEKTTTEAQVSVYQAATCVKCKTLTMSCAAFDTIAFSPDSKHVVTVTAEDRQALVIWQWETDAVEASARVPGGRVATVSVVATSMAALCIVTTGHLCCKTWLWSDSLKVHTANTVFERSYAVVDHHWTSATCARRPTGRLVALARNVADDESSLHVFEGDEVPLFDHRHAWSWLFPRGTQPLVVAACPNGFCAAGAHGFFTLFEYQDDSRVPTARTLKTHDDHIWVRIASTPAGDLLVGQAQDLGLFLVHLGSIAEDDELTVSPLCPVVSSGPHLGDASITSMDISHNQPMLATCDRDGIVRIWNYSRMRCELAHRQASHAAGHAAWDAPATCLGLHPLGGQLLVAYPERLCLYAILRHSLKILREAAVAKCHHLQYAHGGHQVACAAWGISVVVLSSITLAPLCTFSGHATPVKSLAWSSDDLALFSVTTDGNVYGWGIINNTRTTDDAVLLSSSCQCSAIAVRSSSLLAAKADGSTAKAVTAGSDRYKGGGASRGEFGRSRENGRALLIACVDFDGAVRELAWQAPGMSSSTAESSLLENQELVVARRGDEATAATVRGVPEVVTVLAAHHSVQVLFAGTDLGTIRTYDWPDDGLVEDDYGAYSAHVGPVTALRLSIEPGLLFSAAFDGQVFIFAIDQVTAATPTAAIGCANETHNTRGGHWWLEATSSVRTQGGPEAPLALSSADVVQVSVEELEDQAKALADAQKRLETERTGYEFALHRKELEAEAELRRAHDGHEARVSDETARFHALSETHQETVRAHQAEVAAHESKHVQAMHQVENRYEHQLAVEMGRYDELTEEISSIQQQCDGLLQAQAHEHEALIRAQESRAKHLEKELRQQIDRLHEDAKHNEQTFREVLDQQEHEYEVELQQLMLAAQAELAAERENTAVVTGLAQAKNTKIARLEKRMDELKTSSHARNVLLIGEKVRNAKLEATLRHFKHHMEQRESTLEDKELLILELRRKNVTLDNFRFVLDRRVQQLVNERGPVSKHIHGLEHHITAMYDEFEREYYGTKRQKQDLATKDLKILTLGQEAAALRALLRERDAYITSFKCELSTMVNLTAQKDVEIALKTAYHKFVKDEAPSTKASHLHHRHQNSCSERNGAPEDVDKGDISVAELKLKDALAEAHFQRDCMQWATTNLKHGLTRAQSDARRVQRTKRGAVARLVSLLMALCR